MIGYWLLQALENALPGRSGQPGLPDRGRGGRPGIRSPDQIRRPRYTEDDAQTLARRWDWEIRRDGPAWRRVVASPEPQRVLGCDEVGALVAGRSVVICAGGGGIPVTRGNDGRLAGAEAVIDKDLTAALLAEHLRADALLILTDVPAVELGYGTSSARPIGSTTAGELRGYSFPWVDGPQGGGGLPFRRNDGQGGGNRPDGGCSRSTRGKEGDFCPRVDKPRPRCRVCASLYLRR